MDRNLLSDAVYRGTTEPVSASAVRKALRWGARRSLQPLIRRATSLLDIASFQMPRQEEQSDHRDVLALRDIRTGWRHIPTSSVRKIRVPTPRGELLVVVCGQPENPALLTYHDIGYNYSTFLAFFDDPSMRGITRIFCVYHICAPGQDDDAPDLPPGYVFPSLEELSGQLDTVCRELHIHSFVGFGVGLGANVLLRYALANRKMVDALILLNGTASTVSWTDWAHCLMVNRTLRTQGLTPLVIEHLVKNRFGNGVEQRCPILAACYREYLLNHVNPRNLCRLLEVWAHRLSLPISRSGRTLATPVLNATGAQSVHVDDTVHLNGRLNPILTSWIKFQDAGSMTDERPEKIAEALRLFLQGEGFGPGGILSARVPPQRAPPPPCRLWVADQESRCTLPPVMRIIENPLLDIIEPTSVC